MNGQAALSLASIVNRLLCVFPIYAVKALPTDTLRLFADTMTDLTCSFLQAVAKEEEVSYSKGLFYFNLLLLQPVPVHLGLSLSLALKKLLYSKMLATIDVQFEFL